jgi:hypothetical protein
MVTEQPFLDIVIPDDPVLGRGIANYPSDRRRLLLIAGVIGGAAAVALNFTLATIPGWWGPALTIIAMAAITLVLGWYVLHLWNREVVLYERGFSYREGADVVFFLYAEVRGVRLRAERLAYFGGLFRRTVYGVTLTTRTGEVIRLTHDYRRIADLSARLAEAVQREAGSAFEGRLHKGEIVPFGERLGVSRDGLHHDGRVLAWGSLGGTRIADRRLMIFDSQPELWAAIPLTELENPQLLIDVLRERVPR